MKSLFALSAVSALCALLACSAEEFSSLQSSGSNAVPACASGYAYSSASAGCVDTTATPTPTVTPAPTATPPAGATATPVSTPTPTPAGQCDNGSVYSDTYGCLPQKSCGADQGWYGGMCIGLHGVMCEDFCPAGFTHVPGGCLPQTRECPPCSGVDDHGQCWWGVDYLVYWGLM